MPESIYTTSQTTPKRAMIATSRDKNILVWAGEDSAINISTSPVGDYNFKSNPTKYYTSKSPFIVMLGNGETGYLFWSSTTQKDGAYQIEYTSVHWDESGRLKVSDTFHRVPSAYSSDGILAPMLTTQNGQLVINLAWKDASDHLCVTQVEPLKALSLGGADLRLPEKAAAGPFMTTIGGRPIMAYFDDNHHLNIVLARKNTVSFDFDNKIVFKEIKSSFAPAFVTQSSGIGYVFWRNYNGKTLCYQQIGLNSFGDFVMNTQIEGHGVIKDTIPDSAPFARMIFQEKDSHHKTMLQVVWPESGKRYIKIAEFDAHFTALT